MSEAKNVSKKVSWDNISWGNTAFLVGGPLATAILIPVELSLHGWNWGIAAFTVVFAVLSSFGITGGYHRLFAHKSYEARPWVRVAYLLLGASAIQNSALRWCSDHRFHHRFVDTDKDPYNIKRGFFYAHMGWIFLKGSPSEAVAPPPDLAKDPLIQWQHRNYLLLAVLTAGVFPALVGAALGSALGGFVFGGLFRIVFTQHCTFLINSACHMFGNQPYSDRNTARDSWLMAFFSYGEGYHNFHHAFEYDYRNGVRWYQWDPTKWLIGALAALGQVSDLRRTTTKDLLSARMRMAEKQLQSRGLQTETLAALKQRVEQAQDRARALWEEYQRAKAERQLRSREMLLKIREEFKRAQHDFKAAYSEWKAHQRRLLQMATA